MLTPMLAQILIMVSVTYLWLYLAGNEYTAITGGWVTQAWSGISASWTATAPSLSKDTAYMTILLSGNNVAARSGVVGIANLVDLTSIAAIRVTIPTMTLSAINTPGAGRYQRIYLFVTDLTAGDWVSPSVYDALSLVHEHTAGTTETLTDVQYTLNVAALTGNFRVYLGFVWAYQNATSTIRVSAVEMLTA